MVYMKDDDSWSDAKKGAAMAVGAGVAGVIGFVTAPLWGPPVAAIATIIKGSALAQGIATAAAGAIASGSKPV